MRYAEREEKRFARISCSDGKFTVAGRKTLCSRWLAKLTSQCQRKRLLCKFVLFKLKLARPRDLRVLRDPLLTQLLIGYPIQRCEYESSLWLQRLCILVMRFPRRKSRQTFDITSRNGILVAFLSHDLKAGRLLLASSPSLTHYRPAMPFGNRKFYFRGSFQFRIVTIKKNITPLETWNLII